MRQLLISSLICFVFFCFCSKSAEKKGDSFLKKGDKRTAYLMYQRAMQNTANPPSTKLKNKYLTLTLDKAKERLVEDESMTTLSLFHEEFKRYADANTDPAVLRSYSNFLIEWSDSIYLKGGHISSCMELLADAKNLDPGNAEIEASRKKLESQYGENALSKGKEAFESGLKNKEPLSMVEAEYYALCAGKYLPENKEVQNLLAKTRKENLNTYSAYHKALSSGKTDPEIDCHNVYFAIKRQSKSENGFRLEGNIYNLSSTPIELNAKQFTLVGANGASVGALSNSKFEKVALDIKTESPFTLEFPKLNAAPLKLAFMDGNRTGEKWFP